MCPLLVVQRGYAQRVLVPIDLQAELLAKVATYDKNLLQRAGDRVRILLVTKPGSSESSYIANQMQVALGKVSDIGGLPHDETITPFKGAPALAAQCQAQRMAIVFFGPGFTGDIEALRSAFNGADVLSVTAVADYVPNGIVLGFDIVSGKPKLLVNLEQATKQNVNFRAEALRLMKVFP